MPFCYAQNKFLPQILALCWGRVLKILQELNAVSQVLDYTVNILKGQHAQEAVWLQYHLGIVVLPVYSVRGMCVEHRGTTTYHKTHSAVERGAVIPCLQLRFSVFTCLQYFTCREQSYYNTGFVRFFLLFHFELYRPLISHRNSVSQLLCAFNRSRSQN